MQSMSWYQEERMLGCCRCGRVDGGVHGSLTGIRRVLQTDSVSWEQAERWEGGDEEWVGNRCLS